MSASAGPARSVLERLARVAVTQPVARPVAADDEAFFAAKGPLKLAWRVLRRRAELAASGQRRFQVERIDPAWRRAVWFHAEAPQIGDALMDLAPRSLLAEHGIAVDLVAPAPIAALFEGDRWFARVAADDRGVGAGGHDFAIVDSNGWKALAGKRARAASLPWVSVRGDYLAYDYQRAALATRRLAALLDARPGKADEARHARQKLAIGGAPLPAADPQQRIGIAVGGVRAERSYRHWPAVARALAASGCSRLALFGSANGSAAARAVREALGDADIIDLVGRSDLHGTQQAMARCALVVCADGGLLHLACTTATPLVALFDASVDPAWRLPPDFDASVLRAGVRDVSAIDPAAVAAAAIARLDGLRNRGQAGAP